MGLVDEERWERFEGRLSRFRRNRAVLAATRIALDGALVPADRLLRQPGHSLGDVMGMAPIALDLSPAAGHLDALSVETEIKYDGYLQRERVEAERGRRNERRPIPAEFEYAGVPGLSREVVERLSRVRPDTLGQALRVPGVTPAAVAVIAAQVNRSTPRSERGSPFS